MKLAVGIVLCVVAGCLATVASVFGSAVRYAETPHVRTFIGAVASVAAAFALITAYGGGLLL